MESITIEIEQMNADEISQLIERIGYGHLGCIHAGKPYVIPMQYYVQDGAIYLFTDKGQKTQDLSIDSDICLQIEELGDTEHWQSVTITGRAEPVRDRSQFDRIAQFIQTQNPKFAPVINRNLTDMSELENAIAIYQIQSDKMTGSKTKSADNRALV